MKRNECRKPIIAGKTFDHDMKIQFHFLELFILAISEYFVMTTQNDKSKMLICLDRLYMYWCLCGASNND